MLCVCSIDVWKLDLWNAGLHSHGHHCHSQGILHPILHSHNKDSLFFRMVLPILYHFTSISLFHKSFIVFSVSHGILTCIISHMLLLFVFNKIKYVCFSYMVSVQFYAGSVEVVWNSNSNCAKHKTAKIQDRPRKKWLVKQAKHDARYYTQESVHQPTLKYS